MGGRQPLISSSMIDCDTCGAQIKTQIRLDLLYLQCAAVLLIVEQLFDVIFSR